MHRLSVIASWISLLLLVSIAGLWWFSHRRNGTCFWANATATADLLVDFERGVIGRNGKCPRCGYDLRATPDQCPECGTERLS